MAPPPADFRSRDAYLGDLLPPTTSPTLLIAAVGYLLKLAESHCPRACSNRRCSPASPGCSRSLCGPARHHRHYRPRVTMVVDARLVGLGAAVAALLLRVPFLGVVVAAAAVTALSRLAVG